MTEDLYHLGIKGLITNATGEILLLKVDPAMIKNSTPGKIYWDLPGGRVKKGEKVEDTLQREIAEETGIHDIANIQPLGMILANMRLAVGDADDTVGLVLGVYHCTIPADAQIQLSNEHIAYEWVPKQRAAELLRTKFSNEFCDLLANM